MSMGLVFQQEHFQATGSFQCPKTDRKYKDIYVSLQNIQLTKGKADHFNNYLLSINFGPQPQFYEQFHLHTSHYFTYMV